MCCKCCDFFGKYALAFVISMVYCGVAIFFLVILFMTDFDEPYFNASNHGARWIGDISHISQINEDWQTVPFVEIKVEDSGNCSAGWDPVFFNEWKGL